jgi:hypothetical protein
MRNQMAFLLKRSKLKKKRVGDDLDHIFTHSSYSRKRLRNSRKVKFKSLSKVNFAFKKQPDKKGY